jgi:hypothetical protein
MPIYCRTVKSLIALRCLLRRAITEVKQCWSVIGWVTKTLLLELLRASESTLSRWSRLHFAVVSTHQPALGPRGGLLPVLIMCNP